MTEQQIIMDYDEPIIITKPAETIAIAPPQPKRRGRPPGPPKEKLPPKEKPSPKEKPAKRPVGRPRKVVAPIVAEVQPKTIMTDVELQPYIDDPSLLQGLEANELASVRTALMAKRQKPKLEKEIRNMIAKLDRPADEIEAKSKEQIWDRIGMDIKNIGFSHKKPISRRHMTALGSGACCDACGGKIPLAKIADELNLRMLIETKPLGKKRPAGWKEFVGRLSELDRFSHLSEPNLQKLARVLYKDGIYLDNFNLVPALTS